MAVAEVQRRVRREEVEVALAAVVLDPCAASASERHGVQVLASERHVDHVDEAAGAKPARHAGEQSAHTVLTV